MKYLQKYKNKNSDVLILIPVLLEGENLDELLNQFEKVQSDFLILFIITLNKDEDATLRKIKDYSQRDPRINYITNKVRGLGRAYIQGFNHALTNFDFKYLCTMDGDCSHQPIFINKMMLNINLVDLVIASRYIQNGKVMNWNSTRKWGSKFVTYFFKNIFPVSIYDNTSGFRLYSYNLIKKINFNSFHSKGYFFQIEILFKIFKLKGIILELPYCFQGRSKGHSKLRHIDLIEYIFLSFKFTCYFLKKKISLFLRKIGWYFILFNKIINNKFNKTFPNPYRLIVKINNDCNLKCSTCGIWRIKQKEYLSIKKAKIFFNRFNKNLLFLTFTGGEPFLDNNHLLNLIDLAKKRCPNLYFISINTNGFLSDTIFITINFLLQKYNFLHLFIGLNHFPTKDWAKSRTGNNKAFCKSQETFLSLKKLQNSFSKRLKIYKMFTINTLEDANYLKKDKDLWITFAESNIFYNNKNSHLSTLSIKDKKKIVNDFYIMNSEYLGYINRRFLKRQQSFFNKGRRNLYCWAGINRFYINEKGEEFICTRGLKNRKKMDNSICSNCWTPCEAVFDLVQNLY